MVADLHQQQAVSGQDDCKKVDRFLPYVHAMANRVFPAKHHRWVERRCSKVRSEGIDLRSFHVVDTSGECLKRSNITQKPLYMVTPLLIIT
jgi:hypothetical protein